MITLLTDFGAGSAFAAQMKGVILGINDQVHIVDVHHQVPPFDVAEAAVTIGSYYKCFPEGTIHLCVVDPGVGSARRPIIARAAPYFFVGPDNGIFSAIYGSVAVVDVVHITADHFFRRPVSSTFHGRDIFAPVAAWLSRGVAVSDFGTAIGDYAQFMLPSARSVTLREIEGEIVGFDSFGNAITNIRGESVESARSRGGFSKVSITVADRDVPYVEFFAGAPPDALSAVVGSSGCIELFLYRGSAATVCQLKSGQKVRVLFS